MDFRLVIALMLVVHTKAWICGNSGQCICSSNGMVECSGVGSTPLFPPRTRYTRGLVLRVADPRTFDLDSLDFSYGFEFVSLTGADRDLCAGIAAGFPWVTCKYDEVSTSACVGPNCDFFGRIYTSLRTLELAEETEVTTESDGETTWTEVNSPPYIRRTPSQQPSVGYTMGIPTRGVAYWSAKNIGFWGTVFAGLSAGLLLAVIILLVLNRKCRKTDEDPACVVAACKACCKCCCVDPAKKIGRFCGLKPKGRTQYRGGSLCSLESQEEFSRF